MSLLLRGPLHGIAGDDGGILVQDGQIAWVGTGNLPIAAFSRTPCTCTT